MSLKRTVDPAAEPLSRSDAKDFMRVDHTDEDSLVDVLIVAGRQWLESYLRRSLITQTWRMKLDAFPTNGDPITLYMPPIQSVTSVTYTDENGDGQTWSSGNYSVDTDSEPGHIVPGYNVDYPETQCIPQAVTVTYIAGYGDAASDVPSELVRALMVIVEEMYDRRAEQEPGTYQKVPLNLAMLLQSKRIHRF